MRARKSYLGNDTTKASRSLVARRQITNWTSMRLTGWGVIRALPMLPWEGPRQQSTFLLFLAILLNQMRLPSMQATYTYLHSQVNIPSKFAQSRSHRDNGLVFKTCLQQFTFIHIEEKLYMCLIGNDWGNANDTWPTEILKTTIKKKRKKYTREVSELAEDGQIIEIYLESGEISLKSGYPLSSLDFVRLFLCSLVVHEEDETKCKMQKFKVLN